MKDIFRQYSPCFLLLMIALLSGCGGGSDGPVIGGAGYVAGMASVKLSFTVPAGVASLERGTALSGDVTDLALAGSNAGSNESLFHIGGRSLADLLIPNAQAAPPPAGVSLIIVTISGPGMATIVDNIPVTPDAVITRTYNVPVGPNRSIVVQAFNANGTLISTGTTLIPLLQAGVPVTSNVTMVPTAAADTTPPVISLLGTNPVEVAQDVPYVDAGATALDNVDGDITASIVTVNPVNTAVLGAYTVTYNVSDAAGNAATPVTRTVNVVPGTIVDVTPPVITLLGQNPVTVTQGTTYGDAGATASDNVDGDITANLVIVNSVNTAVIGAYTVTYNVTDAAGNAAAPATRTVNVVAAPNQAPSPTAPAITTTTGTAGTSQIAANDPNTGDTHTYVVTTLPANGAATVSTAGLVTYTSNAGYAGPDSLVVTVTDSGTPALSGTVTIPVTVNDLQPVINSLVSNPPGLVPSLVIVDPATGNAAFTLIINGVNFSPNATVTLTQGGGALPLTGVVQANVSAQQITLAIPNAFFAGGNLVPVNVTVTNNTSVSNAVTLTLKVPDLIPPTVISTLPVDTAAGVDTNSPVIVFFSEQIDQATVSAASFKLTTPDSQNLQGPPIQVAGTFSFALTPAGTSIAIFNPTVPLILNTAYTLTLTTAITDLSGNPLTVPIAPIIFTTTTVNPVDPAGAGNLGFELGTLAGYTPVGAASVVNQVVGAGVAPVPWLPTELAWMALIDTGAGAAGAKASTLASGTMTVPAGMNAMIVDVNFLSNEYPNFIGSQFDDFALSTLNTNVGRRTSVVTSVNIAPFVPDPSTAYGGATSFAPWVFDLTGLAGTPVNFQFDISDVGDTSYTSELLIDNVRFVPSAIAIKPFMTVAPVNGTVQFVVNLIGAAGPVQWYVNGVPSGNATVGTINASGLYTAPAVTPASPLVTIEARTTTSTPVIGTATVRVGLGNSVPVL